jgi:hypothetical protein
LGKERAAYGEIVATLRFASFRNVIEDWHTFLATIHSIGKAVCGILDLVGEAEAGNGGDQPATE